MAVCIYHYGYADMYATTLHRGLNACWAHLFLFTLLSAQPPVATSSSLVPDFATVHSVLLVLWHGIVCHLTFELHKLSCYYYYYYYR